MIQNTIKERLEQIFCPVYLDIINESKQHASHASSPKTGESHFKVLIVSTAFENKPLLKRHRAVYSALTHELKNGLHALVIQALTPQEYQNLSS